MLKMADMLASGSENFDEPKTVTSDVIMPRGVLLGISDEESAANVLNIERSEAVRNFFGFERLFTKGYRLEIGVIDFDAGLAEIGDVQEAVSVDLPARCAFIDGAIGPALFGVVDFQDGVDGRRRRARGEVGAGIPAGDGTVFRDKDENGGLAGRCALIQDESLGLPLKTTPVGVDCAPGAKPGGGTTTKSPGTPPASVKMLMGLPLPLKRLEVPELLLPIHHGLPPGERVSPQGFFRLGSMTGAIPGMSETRFVCL